MKVDAEDFRRVYESMNDDALLAVDREELVEVARQCYEVEIGRRGLAAEEIDEPEADIPETVGSGEGMVDLATFTDVDEARLALALLKAAEIPCYLQNDAEKEGNVVTGPGLGAFRLSVPPDLLEEAEEILEAEISEEELAAQAEAAGELEEEEEEEAPEEMHGAE